LRYRATIIFKVRRAKASSFRGVVSPAREAKRISMRNEMRALLANILNTDDLKKAKRAMLDCLMATRHTRIGGTKTDPIWGEVPDHQLRGWMGKTIYEFVAGKPRERVEHEIVSDTGQDGGQLTQADLLRLLRESPEIAASILDAAAGQAKVVSQATGMNGACSTPRLTASVAPDQAERRAS
jgi:hypothetical protein